MPKQSAAVASWDGAPPVSENGFTFVHGELFAEASGKNRHRRATVAELKAHVAAGSDKDKPAHWFEAQLVHYGLKPSKTKAVARMRLFDAVNAGNLNVPEHVSKLEARLKKEWTKNDRDLKKETAATRKSATTKRKAEYDVPAATSSTSKAQNNAKKAKTTASRAGSSTKTDTLKTKAATKATTPKTKTETPKPQKKQTARRGGHSQGLARGTGSTTSQPQEQSVRPMQYARRSSAFMARGRIPAPSSALFSDGYDYDSENNSNGQDSDEDDYDKDDSDEDNSDVALAPLGLLNGSYDVSCEYVESQWNLGPEFSLNLTLEGSSLWGSFNLGICEGVMFFDERPWQSSHVSVPFTWRGRELDGPMFYGNGNRGWMKFLGNGRVEGWIDFSSIPF